MALEGPVPRPTGASPVSGLLRQQVSDVYFMLKRHHPSDAAKFNPMMSRPKKMPQYFWRQGMPSEIRRQRNALNHAGRRRVRH